MASGGELLNICLNLSSTVQLKSLVVYMLPLYCGLLLKKNVLGGGPSNLEISLSCDSGDWPWKMGLPKNISATTQPKPHMSILVEYNEHPTINSGAL